MPNSQNYDVVVIGGGSGLTAAYHAVQEDKSVALITDQPEYMGGTCVNFGCIPTKTLLQSARVIDTIRDAAKFGIDIQPDSLRVNFASIMSDMRRARFDNADGARTWVEQAMTPVYERVHFIDDKLFETVGGERISGDKIFIATGARAAKPPIRGLRDGDYWTNEDVLELDTQPASLIVIGGGYIGAELGYFFAALGTEVTVVNPSDKLLSEDDDVREMFTAEFGKRVRIVTGRAVEVACAETGKSLVVEGKDGATRLLKAEQILVAAGRRANTDGLILSATGVATEQDGAVRVNKYLQTSHPDIYAYGDVIGQGMFKHTSSYEGELAYRNAHGAVEKVDYAANPHAIFSDPEIGAVGLTESQCQAQGLDYQVARVEYADTAKGKILGAPPGFVKLLAETGSDRILGCHIIGPDAATLIHEVVVAMNTDDAKAGLVRNSIHIHPSLPELVHTAFAQLG